MASTISAGTSAGTAIAIAGDTSGALALQTNNGTTAVTIDTSQNFFVNKTAYSDTSGNGFGVFPNSGIPQVSCVGAANSTQKNFTVYSSTDSAYKFYVDYAGTGYYAGNLLIGTTSALGGKVSVLFDGSATNGVRCKTSYASNGSQFVDFVNSSGTQIGYISQNASNTVNYSTSSDYRLKENIAPMVGALATVSTLKPVTYKWKSDGSNGQGFIAHELAEVVPDCVTGEKDAVDTLNELDEDGKVIGTKEVPVYQGIDTSFLVATLTAAIQELNAKVDAQATTIAELQAKVG